MSMKKKGILTAAFLCSLLPMLLSQYGGCRRVQEISGLVNLLSPIGLISAALFFLGVWIPARKRSALRTVGLVGCLGMVASELYQFLTWHIRNISGRFSLDTSFRFAYPEFYVGLAASLAMTGFYIWMVYHQSFKEEEFHEQK